MSERVTYRRKAYHVPNTADLWRHEVLHRYCGTGDIHQAMFKEDVLFGIDAADCMFHAPFVERYWPRYLADYRTHEPEDLPVILDMMQRIASHPELPDPALKISYLDTSLYGRNLQNMHTNLTDALDRALDA